jgi:fumarate reductase subunit D
MKRSNEPLFWALFGAGGMLSALIGPVLIFISGIAVPLGFLLPEHTLSYANARAFAQHPLGGLALLAVIALFLFHGCHRMLHSLHDLGLQTGTRVKLGLYGLATAGTLVAGGALLWIGS